MKPFLLQVDALMDEAIANSVGTLNSEEASRALDRDPYWPKWDSPWWHMTLLWELGLADQIPGSIVRKMIKTLNSHYLRFFPTAADGLPEGADPYRHVACHCALGTIYQVLDACGISVDEELPWLRPWFLKYQLPDGGLNCDEKAYSKRAPKSSVVSTLPPLEAILFCTRRPFTAEEESFLDRGAAYLIAHKLFRSANGNKVIDQAWLKLCFPRFYEYDILRGLHFLKRWADIRKRPAPTYAVGEAMDILRLRFPDGELKVERAVWESEKTLMIGADGRWSSGCSQPASSFELLRQVGRGGQRAPILDRIWKDILTGEVPAAIR
ncbi:MAG: hypothetical protein AAB036_01365 [Elusimicrobiota bacterium]